jgi:hypothetical protein
MPVNYNNTVRTNRLRTALDAIDSKTFVVGSGAGSAGNLVIGTSGLSGATGVLVTIPLQNPAATISGNVLTLAGVPLSATASATGTAALAEIRNNAGTVVVSGLTVGTSGTDITISSTSVASGQTVQVNSGTITHP